MKRGEIYFITSTQREEGSEQRADRPAVIVSNNECNAHSEVVEIVYLTTKPKNDLPTHVFTRSALYPSTILCEQVHSISTGRIGTHVGTLTDEELKNVDIALAISLGLDFGASAAKPAATNEPAEPELEKLLQEMKEAKLQIQIPEPSVELIKAETERDLYRQLYTDLLANVTKGAGA